MFFGNRKENIPDNDNDDVNVTFNVKRIHLPAYNDIYNLYEKMQKHNKIPNNHNILQENSATVTSSFNEEVNQDDIVYVGDEAISTKNMVVTEQASMSDKKRFDEECLKHTNHCIAAVNGITRSKLMNMNPLDFWNTEERRSLFPMLFTVAMMVLAVPAQSASSERVFSGMTSIVSNKRQSLNVNRAAALIDSAYSHSCEKLLVKKEKKGSKKQSKLIEFPLCGSYGDLSDIKFNLVDEDDEDYVPGEDTDNENEDVDELLANDLDGFIVNEEEYGLLTRDASSIINQEDIDFENSSNDNVELNSNGKRLRQGNSMLRDYVPS